MGFRGSGFRVMDQLWSLGFRGVGLNNKTLRTW